MLKTFFISIILSFLCFNFCQADRNNSDPIKIGNKQPVPMKREQKRPTDVQDDNLTCEYLGGKLYFEFEVAEGGAVVDVRKLDSGDSITATDNFGSTFIVTMGQTPGFYEIEVNTADGNTYTGYLYIDE